MSKVKTFVWLADSGEWNGKPLRRGEVHSAEGFPSEVISEWIKTGAAKSADAKEK